VCEVCVVRNREGEAGVVVERSHEVTASGVGAERLWMWWCSEVMDVVVLSPRGTKTHMGGVTSICLWLYAYGYGLAGEDVVVGLSTCSCIQIMQPESVHITPPDP